MIITTKAKLDELLDAYRKAMESKTFTDWEIAGQLYIDLINGEVE